MLRSKPGKACQCRLLAHLEKLVRRESVRYWSVNAPARSFFEWALPTPSGLGHSAPPNPMAVRGRCWTTAHRHHSYRRSARRQDLGDNPAAFPKATRALEALSLEHR